MENFVDKMKFDVRFEFNRLPMRLMHRACSLAEEDKLAPVLFPERSAEVNNTQTPSQLK